MTLALATALFFTFAATAMPNATENSTLEYWEYDPESHRKALYERTAKGLAEQEAELGRPLKAPANWSLERFLDSYLAKAQVDYRCRSPDNWTLTHITKKHEDLLFEADVVGNFSSENRIEGYDKETEDDDDEEESPRKWTFNDFIEKYNPTTVWERINDEALTLGQNYSHDMKFFSLMEGLDSTDELLSLPVPLPPQSGRRWQDQWPIPTGPGIIKLPKYKDVNNNLFVMRQIIYNCRERMTLMQELREQHKSSAVFKMGYLFAKTDYACKVFASLAFKFFRTCSMIRQQIYQSFRLFHHYMDIAHSIERLEARWFDVDILKDLILTNDIIARNFVLKDRNLTTPKMVLEAFNKMFVD